MKLHWLCIYTYSLLMTHAGEIVLNTSYSNSLVTITWPGNSGTTYSVMQSSTLATNSWRTITNIYGSDGLMEFTILGKLRKMNFKIKESINPLFNLSFYVDPNARATIEANKLRFTDEASADLLLTIGREPQAHWLTGDEVDLGNEVQTVIAQAQSLNATPLFVAYNIPKRDCMSHSGGGAIDASSYLEWIQTITANIGDTVAIVILEPDALSLSTCLTFDEQEERYDLIKTALQLLKSQSKAIVYVDAGHSNWIPSFDMVNRLNRVDIHIADGFSLNVANYYMTEDIIKYGEGLSRQLNDIHFVIDSSRNGLGPNTDPNQNMEWCNSPGRALGKSPTAETSHPLIDAYLWIKNPGESDGDCRPGEPIAGEWFQEMALELALNAQTLRE